MTLAARGPAFLTLSTNDEVGVCPKTLAITSEADCRYASAVLMKSKFSPKDLADSMTIDCYNPRGQYKYFTHWVKTSDTRRKNPNPSFKTKRQAICHAGTLTPRCLVVVFRFVADGSIHTHCSLSLALASMHEQNLITTFTPHTA